MCGEGLKICGAYNYVPPKKLRSILPAKKNFPTLYICDNVFQPINVSNYSSKTHLYVIEFKIIYKIINPFTFLGLLVVNFEVELSSKILLVHS